MPKFVMATRVNPEALRSPRSLEDLERKAVDSIRLPRYGRRPTGRDSRS